MKFRQDINSLRAIAVLAVVFFHFDISGFSGGFVGVDVFFVISGFLMAKIIFTGMQTNSFSLKAFYFARGRRIIPALSVLIIAVLSFCFFILTPNDYELLGKHAYSSSLFISNAVYAKDDGYFATASETKWLLHTWSLSLEWQFYLLFPILLTLLKKFLSFAQISSVLGVLTVIFYILSINQSVSAPSSAFFLLPSRSWELLCGSLLFLYPLKASLSVKRFLEIAGVALILFSVFSFTEEILWPGYLAVIPVLGASLIILSANKDSFIGRSKILAWFGKVSYSIYLWHWPIVVAIIHFDLKENNYVMLIGILTSIFMGYLSFRFIECKTRKVNLANKMPLSRINNISLPLVYFITCAVFAVIIKVSDGLPSRVNEQVLVADSERKNKNPRSKECVVTHRGDIVSPKCMFGSNTEVVKAVVLGDSHSNSLISAVGASILDNSGAVMYLGANACHAPMDIKHINFLRCSIYNDWVSNELKSDENLKNTPVIIINKGMIFTPKRSEMSINAHKQGTDAFKTAYLKNFHHDICQLSKTHPLYLMLPIPEMPVNVAVYLGKKFMVSDSIEDITLPLKRYKSDYKDVISLYEQVSRECGVHLLDPTPYLCPNGTCLGSIEGRPLYYDDDHISEYGNTYLIPMFSSIWEGKDE